jgi:hypothetical protein
MGQEPRDELIKGNVSTDRQPEKIYANSEARSMRGEKEKGDSKIFAVRTNIYFV